jgi:hypothetical protein
MLSSRPSFLAKGFEHPFGFGKSDAVGVRFARSRHEHPSATANPPLTPLF